MEGLRALVCSRYERGPIKKLARTERAAAAMDVLLGYGDD
jgi:hypothetical protein